MMYNALVPELAVSNLANSLWFYRDIAGFSIIYQRPEERFAFLQLGAAQLMLDQIGAGRTFGDLNPQTPLGQGLNVQIMVPLLAPLLSAFAAAGIELILPLEARIYRRGPARLLQSQFVVADPDGYLLRSCESPTVLADPAP